jgi:hypothetical protein
MNATRSGRWSRVALAAAAVLQVVFAAAVLAKG